MKQLQSTFDFVYIMVKIFILNGQLYWKTFNVILLYDQSVILFSNIRVLIFLISEGTF